MGDGFQGREPRPSPTGWAPNFNNFTGRQLGLGRDGLQRIAQVLQSAGHLMPFVQTKQSHAEGAEVGRLVAL